MKRKKRITCLCLLALLSASAVLCVLCSSEPVLFRVRDWHPDGSSCQHEQGCNTRAEKRKEVASKKVEKRHHVLSEEVTGGDMFSKEDVRIFSRKFEELVYTGSLSQDNVNQLCCDYFSCLGEEAIPLVGDLLCQMMSSAEMTDRMASLVVLSALRYKEFEKGATIDRVKGIETTDDLTVEAECDGEIDVSRIPDTEDDGEDDVGQRLVYSLVKAGLSDSEMDVRDVACDVLAFLPEEERATLSLHLLDHEDVALRTRILAESLDYDDEAALTINFHALDADDKSLREMASANLIEKTGLVFETADEAFDWYENQQMAKSCLESDVD